MFCGHGSRASLSSSSFFKSRQPNNFTKRSQKTVRHKITALECGVCLVNHAASHTHLTPNLDSGTHTHTHTHLHKTHTHVHTHPFIQCIHTTNTRTMKINYHSTHCAKLTAHSYRESRMVHWRSQTNNPTHYY